MIDAARLKANFAQVSEHGDEVPLFFYSYLFLQNPAIRQLFPAAMASQRDRLLGALVEIVTRVDEVDLLVPFLQNLGRDHRKFDIHSAHYPPVGEALLATMEHFSGASWTRDLAADWSAAFSIVSETMVSAAAEAAGTPPWVPAEVVGHERRDADLAILTLQPETPISYLPGQSLSLQSPQRPRLWRYYSPAHQPRADGLLTFQIRAIAGGWVSSALVHGSILADVLRIGPAVGTLKTCTSDARDVLLMASGTGLAPLLAIAQELLALGPGHRRIHLVHQARTEASLFALAELDCFSELRANVQISLLAESGPCYRAVPGIAAELAVRHNWWRDKVVYICGSESFCRDTGAALRKAGIEESAIHCEQFSYRAGPTRDFSYAKATLATS